MENDYNEKMKGIDDCKGDVSVQELTGLRMKNIVSAPTMGTLPIKGSKITLIIPLS